VKPAHEPFITNEPVFVPFCHCSVDFTQSVVLVIGVLFSQYSKITVCKLFAAEFIVSLAEKHSTFESFKKVLIENGASFSVCILSSVW